MDKNHDVTFVLNKALMEYGVDKDAEILEQLPANWHGDLQFKISIGSKAYSARFVLADRSYNQFVRLTDDILCEQLRLCDLLHINGFPFMKRLRTQTNQHWINVEYSGKRYRFIIFEWIHGTKIINSNEEIADKIGEKLRRLHDLSSQLGSFDLPRKHDPADCYLFIDLIREKLTESVPDDIINALNLHLLEADKHIRIAAGNNRLIPVQGDFNFPNVIWDESGAIKGIVDFDQIGLSSRVEDLAWVIKWYSRTQGIGSHEMSNDLARKLMDSYGDIPQDEYSRNLHCYG